MESGSWLDHSVLIDTHTQIYNATFNGLFNNLDICSTIQNCSNPKFNICVSPKGFYLHEITSLHINI